jgi:hypothetical protein
MRSLPLIVVLLPVAAVLAMLLAAAVYVRAGVALIQEVL